MPVLLLGFWFISPDKKIYLVTAANREAANAKWDGMHGKLNYILSLPAIKCPHCGLYKPPMLGYIKDVTYEGVTPCNEREHQGFVGGYDSTPAVQLKEAVQDLKDRKPAISANNYSKSA